MTTQHWQIENEELHPVSYVVADTAALSGLSASYGERIRDGVTALVLDAGSGYPSLYYYANSSWTRLTDAASISLSSLSDVEIDTQTNRHFLVYDASASQWGDSAIVADDLPAATTSARGTAEIATTAEAQAGSLDTKIITPAKLQDVTATTARSGIAPIATESDMDAGTDDDEIVTPLLLRTRELDIGDLMDSLADDLLLHLDMKQLYYDPDDSSWKLRTSRGGCVTLSGAIQPKSGGLAVLPAGTNLIENPIFALNVTDFWVNANNGTKALSSDVALFGSNSIKITKTTASGAGETEIRSATGASGIAVSGATDYTLSVWVNSTADDNVRISGTWYDSGGTPLSNFGSVAQTSENDGTWKRLSRTYTSPATAAYAKISLVIVTTAANGSVAYFDGVQFVETAYLSDVIHGDRGPGFSWNSTPHNTDSSRTATEVNLDDLAGVISENNTFSISMWVKMPYDSDLATWPFGASYIFDAFNTGTRLGIRYRYTANDISVFINDGAASTTFSPAISFSEGDILHIVVAFDFSNDSYNLYINGELEGSDTTSLSAPTLTQMNLGSLYSGTEQAGFSFYGFEIFDSVLTTAQISALYRAGRYIDTQPLSERQTLHGATGILASYSGAALTDTSTSYAEAGSDQVTRFYHGGFNSGMYQFQARLKSSNASGVAYARLEWNDGGTWREVPGSEVSVTGTTADLEISDPCLISPAIREYRVAIKSNNGSYTASLIACELKLSQGL